MLISHRQYLAWGLVKFSTYLLSQSATVNIWLGDLWNFQLISILDSHLQYLAAGADEDANLSKVTLPVAQVAASKWISTCSFFSQRPYHAECTSSRPITEVKQHWALLVLGWETAWEHRVLLAFCVQLFPTQSVGGGSNQGGSHDPGIRYNPHFV